MDIHEEVLLIVIGELVYPLINQPLVVIDRAGLEIEIEKLY